MSDRVDDPEDECECGDWRSDHPGDGPCRFNGRGFDMCHGGRDCMGFRLTGRKGWRNRATLTNGERSVG